MHACVSLQYRQLRIPGVNCVCSYHGGSPASSDRTLHNQNLCANNNFVWIALESEVGLHWLARCIGLYANLVINS